MRKNMSCKKKRIGYVRLHCGKKKNENLYAEPVRFLDDNSFGVAMTEKKIFWVPIMVEVVKPRIKNSYNNLIVSRVGCLHQAN